MNPEPVMESNLLLLHLLRRRYCLLTQFDMIKKKVKKEKDLQRVKKKRRYAEKGVRCILAMAVSGNAGNQQ